MISSTASSQTAKKILALLRGFTTYKSNSRRALAQAPADIETGERGQRNHAAPDLLFIKQAA
jgi:hypothetical protein